MQFACGKVKGMLVINTELGNKMAISESCVKARAPGQFGHVGVCVLCKLSSLAQDVSMLTTASTRCAPLVGGGKPRASCLILFAFE